MKKLILTHDSENIVETILDEFRDASARVFGIIDSLIREYINNNEGCMDDEGWVDHITEYEIEEDWALDAYLCVKIDDAVIWLTAYIYGIVKIDWEWYDDYKFDLDDLSCDVRVQVAEQPTQLVADIQTKLIDELKKSWYEKVEVE